MSCWKAAGVHLTISLLIGLVVLALLFWVWYPAPYFAASGGQHLLVLLLGIDLVLGPMLTLVVFKTGKRLLKLDLVLIGFVQTCALLYGLHVIVQSRPVFIVAAVDRFNSVSANELDPADLALGKKPEFRSLSWTGPRVVGVDIPVEGEASNELMTSSMAGKDVQYQPRYFVDYAASAPNILTRAKRLDVLRKANAASGPIIDRWLKSAGHAEDDVVWLPLNARKSSLTMILDARTAAVLGALEFDPW